MSQPAMDQILQLVAWFLTLAEFIVGLYILLLNVWHTANRHIGGLVLLYAINNLALGAVVVATDAAQAAWSTYVLAATSPVVSSGLFLATVALLRPHWLRGRRRWVWWPVYGLLFLPTLLILVDVGLGTRLWYTGLDATTYAGGYVSMGEYTAGILSLPIRVLNFYLLPLAPAIFSLYVVLDRKGTRSSRRLAWLMLGTQVVVTAVQFGPRRMLGAVVSALIASTIYILVYAYAAFRQVISERCLQRGSLQIRLTALVLAVTVPILVAVVAFVTTRAGALIEQVVVQQQEAELLDAIRQFQGVSWTMLAMGTAMLLILTWLTIRQALRPIGTLTETATAIAAGDLSRVAPVESEDEIGALARSFNSMTERLRGSISGLEQSVRERTADLERRSKYLQATAEVGRAVASILEPEKLIQQVAELIRDRFSLYHVGLFLVDEAGEWAVLRAGTGEPGRAMVARGHRLRVGEGMIGWSIANAQSRIALEVGDDAARLASPELPDTRSEAALPLNARGRVIGALMVQSDQPGAFDEDTVTVLQTMADQVAVALDNARLFTESQAALETAQSAYGEMSRQAWTELLRTRTGWGYRYARGSIQQVGGAWRPEMRQAERTGQTVQNDDTEEPTLAVPLKVREQVVGVLSFRKSEANETWTAQEIEVLETLVYQLGVALESAQLYQDSQRSAAQEQLVGELATRMRQTLDVETVLRTAVQEVRQALDLPEVVVRLTKPV